MQLETMRFFFLHGFNDTSSGNTTTDKLVDYFIAAGANPRLCKEFDYGYLGLIGVRLWTDSIAERLAEEIGQEPAVVVCHSHGNVIAHLAASKYGANIVYHIAINPALNVKTQFAKQIHQIDTYYTPGDRVVTLGKWWRYNPYSLLMKRHWWGEAGRKGFKVKDKRHYGIDMSKPPRADMPAANSHSGFFKGRNIRFWGPWLAERSIEAVKKLLRVAPFERRQQFAKALTKQLVFALSEGLEIELEDIESVKLGITKNGKRIDDELLSDFTERWEAVGGVRCLNGVYRLRHERLVM